MFFLICTNYMWIDPYNQSCLSIQLALSVYCVIGLVVKASAPGVEDPGFKSPCNGIFSGLSHTSDLKNGTPVAILPGAWRYRVSAGTGRPGVSLL